MTETAYLRLVVTGGPSKIEPADVEGLGFQIFLDTGLSALAAEPRLLDTAKGGHFQRQRSGVQPDHARLQPLGDAERAREVARVEITGKAVRRGIGQIERLSLAAETVKRRHCAERLFRSADHAWRCAT